MRNGFSTWQSMTGPRYHTLLLSSTEHLFQGAGADQALSPAEEPLRISKLDSRPVPAGERAELPLRLPENELHLSLPPPLLLPLTRPLEQGVSTHIVSL